MFVTLVSEHSFLFFSKCKEQLSFMNRDNHLQDLIESKKELLSHNLCAVPKGSPCLISTLERVTYSFNASEPTKSFLGFGIKGWHW